MKYALEVGTDNLVSINRQLSVMSMESAGVTDMLASFAGIGHKLVLNIKNSEALILGFIGSNDVKVDSLGKLNDKALVGLSKVNYVTYAENTITLPENFKGDLLQYAKDLLSVIHVLYKTNDDVLTRYNGILASFLTNKDSRKTLVDHTVFFKEVRKTRERILDNLGSYSVHNGGNRAKLSTVVKRMTDIKELFRYTNDVAKLQNKSVIHNLNANVTKAVSMLDDILKQIKDGHITELTGTAAMNLSTGAYEVAKLIELVSVVYYDVEVLLTITNAIALDLSKE